MANTSTLLNSSWFKRYNILRPGLLLSGSRCIEHRKPRLQQNAKNMTATTALFSAQLGYYLLHSNKQYFIFSHIMLLSKSLKFKLNMIQCIIDAQTWRQDSLWYDVYNKHVRLIQLNVVKKL
jgi:hypothetical protein